MVEFADGSPRVLEGIVRETKELQRIFCPHVTHDYTT